MSKFINNFIFLLFILCFRWKFLTHLNCASECSLNISTLINFLIIILLFLDIILTFSYFITYYIIIYITSFLVSITIVDETFNLNWKKVFYSVIESLQNTYLNNFRSLLLTYPKLCTFFQVVNLHTPFFSFDSFNIQLTFLSIFIYHPKLKNFLTSSERCNYMSFLLLTYVIGSSILQYFFEQCNKAILLSQFICLNFRKDSTFFQSLNGLEYNLLQRG